MLLTFCTIANSSTLSKVIFCHVNVWRLTSLRLVLPCSCLIYKKLKKDFQNFNKYPDNIQRSFQWCTLSVLCCKFSYSAVLFHTLQYLSVRRCTFSHSAVPLYSVVPFCSLLYLSLPCCNLLYSSVPCRTLLYLAALCCTSLYSDHLSHNLLHSSYSAAPFCSLIYLLFSDVPFCTMLYLSILS